MQAVLISIVNSQNQRLPKYPLICDFERYLRGVTQKADGHFTDGNMIRVVHHGSGSRTPDFYPSRITNPGVKKAPDPGSEPQKIC